MTDEARPSGYTESEVIWCVQAEFAQETGNDGSLQLAAFTTEAEAQKMLDRILVEGIYAHIGYTDIGINVIPVHRRVEDWDWDR